MATQPFANTDVRLRDEAGRLADQRRRDGLDALIGPLRTIILNTEPQRHAAAVAELLATTGLVAVATSATADGETTVLCQAGSPDFLIRTRRGTEANPFRAANRFPKTAAMPNTRLETFVFETPDITALAAIQRARGVGFLTAAPVRTESHLFLQTPPSPFTGNSIGYIQWLGKAGDYGIGTPQMPPEKPARAHLRNIGILDHAATRIRAEDRDAAILEFMNLTGHDFTMAIYVEELNSVTNVARRPGEAFAMVFTSGVSPYISDEQSGPTEKFVHHYGPRVHHLAFRTEAIGDTVAAQMRDGMRFLSPLVGSPAEGLQQIFSEMSPHSLLVIEYILRYGAFDGFFARSNVKILTEATGRQ